MLQHKQMSETKRLLFHFMNERRLEYLIRACKTKKKKKRKLSLGTSNKLEQETVRINTIFSQQRKINVMSHTDLSWSLSLFSEFIKNVENETLKRWQRLKVIHYHYYYHYLEKQMCSFFIRTTTKKVMKWQVEFNVSKHSKSTRN